MRPALAYPILLCLLLPACEPNPESTRQNVIQRERETFVYHRSAPELYHQARQLLAERGHELPATPPPVNTTVASPWRSDGHRFLVRIIPVDRGEHLVHITGQSRDRDGNVYFSERWNELEWELIQRVEPDRAVDIAAQARRQADDVHRKHNRPRRRVFDW